MMRMGPEALLVRTATDVRIDLAEFAREEFYDEDPRVVERRVRSCLDGGEGLARPGFWARAREGLRFGRGARPDGRPVGPPGPARVVAADPCLAGRTLAAMPAALAPVRPHP
jgi:hypothetical protein